MSSQAKTALKLLGVLAVLLLLAVLVVRGARNERDEALPAPAPIAAAESEALPAAEVPTARERESIASSPSAASDTSVAAELPVRGRVVDEQGAAVPGALVRLVELGQSFYPNLSSARAADALRGESSTQTDARGHFGFESGGSCARAHLLAVEAEGFAPLERFEPRLAEPVHDFGELVLRRGCELRGRVIDTRGRPVEGCELCWARTTSGQLAPLDPGVAATSSGADGCFRIEHLPAGLLRVCAGRERLASDWSAPIRVAADAPSAELELVVERAVLVRGSVRDADSGAPIAARIVLFPHQGERCISCSTRADGLFELWCRAATGSLTYIASAQGYPRNDGENVLRLPADGTDPNPLSILLRRRATIEFLVRDAASGAPIAEAEFIWLGDGEDRAVRRGSPLVFESLRADARADATGRIRLAPDQLREPWGLVRAAGHAPHFCSLGDLLAPQATIDLVAGAVLDVELRATDASTSGVGVELCASGSAGLAGPFGESESERDLRGPLARVESGADGHVRFADLPPGTYAVQARGVHGSSERARDLELTAGAQRSIVLQVIASGSISGRITRPKLGDAPPRIVARDASGRCYRATVDAREHYAIEGLPPGHYELGRAWSGTGLGKHAQAFDLHAGEHAVLDLDAHLVRLRGRVLENDVPAPRCTVRFVARAEPREAKSREEWTACTDTEGRFELVVADDFAGSLRVEDCTANSVLLPLAVRELDPASVEGELEIACATGSVKFECVERGSHSPLDWSQVELVADAAAGGVPGVTAGQSWTFSLPESGQLEVRALPAGNYRVTSIGRDGLRSEPSTLCVRARESVRLEIELARGK